MQMEVYIYMLVKLVSVHMTCIMLCIIVYYEVLVLLLLSYVASLVMYSLMLPHACWSCAGRISIHADYSSHQM